MRQLKYFVFLFLILSACQSIQHRIDKNLDVYVTLPPETQQKIKAGKIDLGFTYKLVYLSWGDPTDKMASTDKSGSQETWVYTNSRSETHYRDVRYHDAVDQKWKTRREEYQVSYTYASHYVGFKDGKVERFGNFPSGIPYPISRHHLDQYIYQAFY